MSERRRKDQSGLWVRATVIVLIVGALAIAGGYWMRADEMDAARQAAAEIDAQIDDRLAAIDQPPPPIDDALQQAEAPQKQSEELAPPAPPDVAPAPSTPEPEPADTAPPAPPPAIDFNVLPDTPNG